MTTQEKLQHFYDSTIAAANKRSAAMMEEYKSALEQVYQEHTEEVLRRADLEIKIETDKLKRQNNKELSMEQIQIKRILNKKHEELKEKLLVDIKNLLEEYMSTADYQLMLVKQIKEAKDFAKDEDIIIYIDPADSAKQAALEAAAGTAITVSEYSFMGGTRAVIPTKSVLIDNSFLSKLEELKQKLSIEGGYFDE